MPLRLAGKLCKPAASLLLPATLAAALWSGAQNCSDVEAVRNTQLVSVDTFDSSRNAHLLTLHLSRCTHRFCMHAWTWCGQTEKMKTMAIHRYSAVICIAWRVCARATCGYKGYRRPNGPTLQEPNMPIQKSFARYRDPLEGTLYHFNRVFPRVWT